MNQGGEPGHDDYGLPRVDIQVPDDARELYRDVQAYHRELRALRRHERSRRWRAPLRRSGMIVPLIAGCLVLAMIAGMVLTMFSANPYFSGTTGQEQAAPRAGNAGRATGRTGPASPASASQSATGTPSGGPSPVASLLLVGKTISVAGKRVTGTALAYVPAKCRCTTLVGRLLEQAVSAGVTIYLIGGRGSLTELNSLASASAKGTAKVAIDADNELRSAYRPSGLTILLVDSRGGVTVAPKLRSHFQMVRKLRSLRLAP